MNTELQKRLEEAAKEYANKRFPKHCHSENNRRAREDYQLCRDSHIAGAEQGFKEAIKVINEWLKEKQSYYHECSVDYGELTTWERDMARSKEIAMDELLTDFEPDMNKLWEEKK